jgi:hypothetical protein
MLYSHGARNEQEEDKTNERYNLTLISFHMIIQNAFLKKQNIIFYIDNNESFLYLSYRQRKVLTDFSGRRQTFVPDPVVWRLPDEPFPRFPE